MKKLLYYILIILLSGTVMAGTWSCGKAETEQQGDENTDGNKDNENPGGNDDDDKQGGDEDDDDDDNPGGGDEDDDNAIPEGIRVDGATRPILTAAYYTYEDGDALCYVFCFSPNAGETFTGNGEFASIITPDSYFGQAVTLDNTSALWQVEYKRYAPRAGEWDDPESHYWFYADPAEPSLPEKGAFTITRQDGDIFSVELSVEDDAITEGKFSVKHEGQISKLY